MRPVYLFILLSIAPLSCMIKRHSTVQVIQASPSSEVFDISGAWIQYTVEDSSICHVMIIGKELRRDLIIVTDSTEKKHCTWIWTGELLRTNEVDSNMVWFHGAYRTNVPSDYEGLSSTYKVISCDDSVLIMSTDTSGWNDRFNWKEYVVTWQRISLDTLSPAQAFELIGGKWFIEDLVSNEANPLSCSSFELKFEEANFSGEMSFENDVSIVEAGTYKLIVVGADTLFDFASTITDTRFEDDFRRPSISWTAPFQFIHANEIWIETGIGSRMDFHYVLKRK